VNARVSSLSERLFRRLHPGAIRREAEEEQMSPAERRLVSEPAEYLQADHFVEEHLGGIDPRRLEDW
jgi:ethanolamine utilization cobalamin adenosyltransferase